MMLVSFRKKVKVANGMAAESNIRIYVMWFNADSGKKTTTTTISVRGICSFACLLRLLLLLLHFSASSCSVRTLFIFHIHCVCLVFYENSEYTLKVLLDIFLNCVQCKISTILPILRHIYVAFTFRFERTHTHMPTIPCLVAESLSLCTTLFNVISISGNSHTE